MKRIFSKEKMWEVEKNDEIELLTINEMEEKYPWVNRLDGGKVEFGEDSEIGTVKIKDLPVPYIVRKEWTVEVDDDFDNDFKVLKKESKKVFSIDKWYETTGKHFAKQYGIKNKKDLLELCEWCNKCEGREPINNKIDFFEIPDEWCVDINEYERFEI